MIYLFISVMLATLCVSSVYYFCFVMNNLDKAKKQLETGTSNYFDNTPFLLKMELQVIGFLSYFLLSRMNKKQIICCGASLINVTYLILLILTLYLTKIPVYIFGGLLVGLICITIAIGSFYLMWIYYKRENENYSNNILDNFTDRELLLFGATFYSWFLGIILSFV